jgi:hypothetical protein
MNHLPGNGRYLVRRRGIWWHVYARDNTLSLFKSLRRKVASDVAVELTTAFCYGVFTTAIADHADQT